MARFFKRQGKKKGLSPGSLVFIGEQKLEQTRIRVIHYGPEQLVEFELEESEIAAQYKQDTRSVTWINIDGLHNTDIINRLGEQYALHPLILEDIVNTGQRPKFEDVDNALFFTLKMLYVNKSDEHIQAEQLSLVLGENFVITFQERIGDVFEPVRERLRKGKGRLRQYGSAYLAYAILDVVADHYIDVIAWIGEKIEDLEDEIVNRPDETVLEKIRDYKIEMSYLRKAVRPVKEMVQLFMRSESNITNEAVQPFLRDLHDLII